MKHAIIFALIGLWSINFIVQGEGIANSSYPINKANPQRNNHMNRPILCSAVSNGKTTVLNLENTYGGGTPFFYYGNPPVLDDQNNIYAVVNYNTIVKIDASTLNLTLSVNFNNDAQVTVGTSNLYVSSATTTAIYRPSDFSQLKATSNTGGDGTSSLAPYAGLLIRARIGEAYTSTLASYEFFNITDGIFQATPQSPYVGSPRDAIVYKTDSTEFPIFVGQYNDENAVPTIVISALGRYAVNISNAQLQYQYDPFVVDSTLIIFTGDGDVYHYNAETGAFLKKVSWKLFGDTNLVKNAIVKGSKALASFEAALSEEFFIAELYSNATVLSNLQFAGNPVFSLVDDVVLMTVADSVGYIQLLGLDWNDWSVRVVGEIGIPGNAVTSEPVIGEDCSVHIIVDGQLQTYRPLPLQKVVPVIECIESDNTAYFSYTNLESRSFNIPFVSDRNNLMPMAVAPVVNFNVGTGAHYPLGASIVLTTNPSGSYKWILEDYTLEFANTPSLRCPTNISLGLTFTASSSFDVPSFTTIVYNAFLNVTGVSGTRVTIGNLTSTNSQTKRAVSQTGDSSLELELQVGPGNQGDPSPSSVVTNFVTNQQEEFNNQVSSDPNAPSNVALTSVTTKQPQTAQSGVLNAAPPTSEPVSSVPQSQTTPVMPPSSSNVVLAQLAVILSITFAFIV